MLGATDASGLSQARPLPPREADCRKVTMQHAQQPFAANRRRRWMVAIALVLVAQTGCSLMFVKPPPPPQLWDRIGWARCTQSKAWPVIDTVMAVSSAAVVMLPAIGSDEVTGFDNTQTTLNIIQLAGWAFSAYYGFKNTNLCQSFWLHQMQRRQGYPQGRTPQPYRPQAAPPSRGPAPTPAPAPAKPPASGGQPGVLEPPPPAQAPPAAPGS